MKWTEIEPRLRKRAAEVAGYEVFSPGDWPFRGFGWKRPGVEWVEWGHEDADAAWDAAFADLCGQQEVYRHKKGGIYVGLMTGRLTFEAPAAAGVVGGSEAKVYRHLAPHEPGVWIRPLAEFEEEGRFVRIS